LSSGPPRYPGTFLLAFREALAGLNWHARHWLGDSVECVDNEGVEHTVGLENLFRRARREDRSNWPALISEFLQRLISAEKTAVTDADLLTLADQVLVRLTSHTPVVSEALKVWSRPLEGTSLFINLVIDQPDTMSYVTEEMIEKSAKPGEDWLEEG